MWPREGEYTLRESDILDLLAEEGPSIALVIFSGVQYYTGQWFPMQAITSAANAQVNMIQPTSSRLRIFFIISYPVMT
jgi:kynureninase